jgi:hypothetical protein
VDTNFINVTNRSLGNTDDFATIGELQRTPAVIPSKGLGQEAVIIEAATAGSTGGAGAFDDLRAQFEEQPCDPAVAAYEDAVRQNEAIRSHNANLDAAIADAETEAKHLRALLGHIDAKGDGVLTFSEIQNLALNSSIPEVREAAEWMLGHREVYESLPRKWTLLGGDTDIGATGFDDGCGIDVRASASHLGALKRKVEGLEAQRRQEVPMPANPATGNTGATTVVGAVADAVAAGAGGVGTPWSTAIGDGSAGLEAAMGGLSDAMAGLEAELAKAAEECKSSDPKVAANAEKRMNELSRKLQKLSAMMTMLNATLSNIAKVYSDMAMTSVRNMK